MRPSPDSLLPLKPTELMILTMLTAGELHGYAVRQAIIEHTRGAMRLEADGLVEESARRPAEADDERRRYYRLTPFGRRVLASEMLRLRELVRLAEERRVIAPSRA